MSPVINYGRGDNFQTLPTVPTQLISVGLTQIIFYQRVIAGKLR